MQDIIKEYGPALITVVAVVALIGLVTVMVNGEGSTVGQAFKGLIDNFFLNASNATKSGLAGGVTSGVVH